MRIKEVNGCQSSLGDMAAGCILGFSSPSNSSILGKTQEKLLNELESPIFLVCPGLRDFLGCGNFSAKNRKIPSKLG